MGMAHGAVAQKIYTVKNGIPYRITGSNGVIFNSDGSIMIMGEEIINPINNEELIFSGNKEINDNCEPIKLPCGASQALIPSADGKGGIYQSIHGNKCGPISILFSGDTKIIKCLNQNNYLCSAKFCHDSNDCVYVNYDCNW